MPEAADEALVIVSSDTHIGPRSSDLREYCPSALLQEFDAHVAEHRAAAVVGAASWASSADSPQRQALVRNLQTAGHHDIHARLRDLDRDGVACEVVFHGSQNSEPMPFQPVGTGLFEHAPSELLGAGYHIYNQWLADALTVEPARHVGLAYLPMWDVDEAVAELRWAHEAGLKGVNFPAPRAGIRSYDDPAWEPLWVTCAALGTPLFTHSGAGSIASYRGAHGACLFVLEAGGWPSRRALPHLLFSGVFERHPGLRLVLAEQAGDWWLATMREYDSVYATNRWRIAEQVPRRPSEYCADHVFQGASFIAPWEVVDACAGGYERNVLWGSDYPHSEGTWQYAEDDGEPMTHLALRYAFAGAGPDGVRRILGENAVDALGLDRPALAAVAARIGAPTLGDLADPLDDIPAGGGFLAFRQVGPYG